MQQLLKVKKKKEKGTAKYLPSFFTN